jgi:RNA polymerase sigma-70 factor, ECF subfamily
VTELAGAAVPAQAAAARADELHRRYRRAILEYCVRRLRSREEGEDAAQMVFLNAYRSLGKGVEPHSERAWLFTIAAHVVSHRHRTNSRRLRFEVPVDVDDLAYLAVAPSLEDAPDLTGLVEALSEMPALQRRAFLLREWRGLTYQEVANELGVSATVVEVLLARGRHRLADRLQDLGRTSKRRVLGLCLPWPSFQSLIGSGAAVKGLAGAASIVFVTGALPLTEPANRAPAHHAVAAVRAAPARAARRERPVSRHSAHTVVASLPTRIRTAPQVGPSASPPAPTIPTETPPPAAAAADGDAGVAVADVSTSAPQTADPAAGAPDPAQRWLDSDSAGPSPASANATVPPPAAARPAQSNAGDGQGEGGAAKGADRGSSAVPAAGAVDEPAETAPKAGPHPALRLDDGS